MLKQLMINKKIEQRKAELEELLKQEQGLKIRSDELEAAIEEAKTDEEMATVEEETTKLEKEQGELKEKKSKLEDEIAELENELEQLKSKEPKMILLRRIGESKEQGGEVRMKEDFCRYE